MLVNYRNNFLKAFLVGVVIWLLVGAAGVYMVTSSYSILSLSDTEAHQRLQNMILISKLIIPVGFLGYGFLFWSGYLLARAKGYNALLSILFALTTFVIVALLPDISNKQK